MKKIKVIEIINALQLRAGAEVFFLNLCVQMCKRKDVELTVIVLYGGIHESFLDLFSKHKIKYFELGKKKHFDLKASRLLRKKIKEINPDIINTHLSFLFTYFFSFGFKKTKWKLIHTVHNIAEKEITIIDKFLRPIYIRKHIISFIGISDLITESIKKIHKNCVVNTIYNGINIVVNFSKSIKQYDFICVARFSPQKNHVLLLEAFYELLKNYPTAKLLCVGGGPLLDENKEYVNVNGLNNNVIFAGIVDNVDEYLAQSKTLVLSSKYEGNPICVLEAMSHGLQIVAPEVGGIPDVIENNVNGFLFKVDNKDELLSCLEKAYLGGSASLIKSNNLEKIKKYSIEKTSDEYVNLFKKVAKKI